MSKLKNLSLLIITFIVVLLLGVTVSNALLNNIPIYYAWKAQTEYF